MNQSSTGPVTEAGKFESSKNALTHGLTASSMERFPESIRDTYRLFLRAQYREWQPQTDNEKIFLERYAFNQFQILRAQPMLAESLEELLAHPKDLAAQKQHALVSRHLRALERSARETLKELRTLIADRLMALEVDLALQEQEPNISLPDVFPHHLVTKKQTRLRSAADNALRFAYHLPPPPEAPAV